MSSFAAAYFIDFAAVLRGWAESLRLGGWIALTEIDDLFGHEPLSPGTKALLDSHCDDAIAAGRYDFRSGRKLKHNLETAGFSVTGSFTVPDRELSFEGPADPAVVEAWRARFQRMGLLQRRLAAKPATSSRSSSIASRTRTIARRRESVAALP